MKVIFVCGNVFHLYLATSYKDYLKSKINADFELLLLNTSFGSVKEMKSDWNKVVILNKKVTKGRYNSLLVLLKMKSVMKKMEQLYTGKDHIILFTFLDHTPIMKKIINHIKKINNKNSLYLVEEGLGLYTEKNNKGISKRKKFFYSMLDVDKPYEIIQGENEKIDGIILQNPDYLPSNKKIDKKMIVQGNSVFSEENINRFCELYFSVPIESEQNITKYDFLFIGQNFTNEKDILLLKEILKIIPKNMNIIIKPHPRENEGKYSEIVKNLDNCTIVNKIYHNFPIELLQKRLSVKTVLTFYSSAALNFKKNDPSLQIIFLYKLLNLKIDSLEKIVRSNEADGISIIENTIDFQKTISKSNKTHVESLSEKNSHLEEMEEVLKGIITNEL